MLSDTASHYVAQAGFERVTLLLQLSGFWDYASGFIVILGKSVILSGPCLLKHMETSRPLTFMVIHAARFSGRIMSSDGVAVI